MKYILIFIFRALILATMFGLFVYGIISFCTQNYNFVDYKFFIASLICGIIFTLVANFNL